MIQRSAGLIKGIAVIFIVLAIFLFVRSLPVERPLEWLTGNVEALGAWGPIAFACLYVILTVILLPGWPITVAAGAVFGPLGGTAVVSLASTASAALSFLIGRYLAHRKVARVVSVYPKLAAVYETLGRQGGWKIVAAVRLSHALPFGLQNFLFGLTPIRFWPYLFTSWAVMLPGSLLYAYLGHVGAAALEAAARGETPVGTGPWLARGLGLLAAAAALIYVTQVARKAVREQMAANLNRRSLSEAPWAAEAEPAAGEEPVKGWPWASLGILLAALVILATAAWSYEERDTIRQRVERWFPDVPLRQ